MKAQLWKDNQKKAEIPMTIKSREKRSRRNKKPSRKNYGNYFKILAFVLTAAPLNMETVSFWQQISAKPDRKGVYRNKAAQLLGK